MIEIVTEKDRNLKNIKQIGTPREEDKIYIENLTYVKLKENSYKDKRVFVLMGHTERMQGRYATFVEAAIPVKEIEFTGSVPHWTNSIWSAVFKEIKRLYEDIIIVGWAMDVKGMSLKSGPELERIHREYFGGAHQILFLMDTLENEETFYVYKENHLIPKDGFYIYHRAHKKEIIPITVISEEALAKKTAGSRSETGAQSEYVKVKNKKQRDVPNTNDRGRTDSGNHVDNINIDVNVLERNVQKGGRYRQLMREKKKKPSMEDGNAGLAIAAAMLVFVIGVGAYENRDELFGSQGTVQTNIIQNEQNISQQEDFETEETEIQEQTEGNVTETGAQNESQQAEAASAESTAEEIPVDVISGSEQTQ